MQPLVYISSMEVEPVGLVEIAQRLNVQRNTAKVWHARGLLPAHRWTVSGNPAWNWPEVKAWAQQTGRMSKG